MTKIVLLSSEIKKTCLELHLRISERFPKAKLAQTCKSLIEIAEETDKTIKWIKTPNQFIRISSWLCAFLLLTFFVPIWVKLEVTVKGVNIADFFQMLDSSFNIIVLISAAGFFLMSTEIKRKRKRVVKAINALKTIAHIIDAHQLIKDPSFIVGKPTLHSPERTLSDFELIRYLDYCTEMLSIISKIAFLYIQDFDDPIANESVSDLETLTASLSQNIWQKLNISSRSLHANQIL